MQSKTQQTVQTLSLGLVSGTLASIANIPYDVAKSRIQGPEIKLADGRFKYRGAHQAMLLVAREEGWVDNIFYLFIGSNQKSGHRLEINTDFDYFDKEKCISLLMKKVLIFVELSRIPIDQCV